MATRAPIQPIQSAFELSWLSGILEGEGSFILSGSRIFVVLVMTDEDVVRRAAALMGVACVPLKKRLPTQKQPFSCRVSGERAAVLMQQLLPFMGQRRQAKIKECLRFISANRKTALESTALRTNGLSDTALLSHWRAKSADESFRSFAMRLGGLNRSHLKARLSRLLAVEAPSQLPNLSLVPNAWVAGLLEGEGCFSILPSPTIHLVMSDTDVVTRFCAHIGASQSTQVRKNHDWKPVARVCFSGVRAADLMQAILPHMGIRRAAKISECLAAFAVKRAALMAKKASSEILARKLMLRWTHRQMDDSLRRVARELGLSPQGLKNNLIRLGVYHSPAIRPQ